MYIGHLDLNHPLYWTLDAVMSVEECARFIARMNAAVDAEVAPITALGGGAEVNLKVRNNTRIMFDDATWAATLFERVREHVPAHFQGRPVAGANTWLRCYRYGEGERHGSHWDTRIRLEDGRTSELTFVIYLNDDFEGGRTLFPELDFAAVPAPGRALLFQHKVLHEAETVHAGAKYVLRSEIMYGP